MHPSIAKHIVKKAILSLICRVANTYKRTKLVSLVLTVVVMWPVYFVGNANAMPSLDPKDALTVTYPANSRQKFTVIRDHADGTRWYLFPNQPRLASRVSAGKSIPQYNLLRYSFPNPEKPGSFKQGGILQFSSVMDLPSKRGIDVIKGQIVRALSNDKEFIKNFSRQAVANDIIISAMPFKKAQVNVYLPGKGEKSVDIFVGGGSRTSGVAPQFATQQMPFTVELTSDGADVYDAMTTSEGGGVNVIYDVTYEGITPEVGFKVTVDWNRILEHTSQSIKNRNSFAGNIYGVVDVDAAVGVNDRKVADYLESNNFVKIEVTFGKNFTKKDAKELMAPIIAEIRGKAFKGDRLFPDQLTRPSSANAKDTNSGGGGGSGGQASNDSSQAGGGDGGDDDDEGNDEGNDDDGANDDDEGNDDDGANDDDEGNDDDGDNDSAGDDDERSSSVASGDADDAKDPSTDTGSGKVIPTLVPTFKTETNISMNYEYMKSTGSEVFEYRAREVADRTTLVGGNVSVGEYLKKNPKMHDKLVTVVGRSDAWTDIYFTLPGISADLAAYGLTRESIAVQLVDDSENSINGIDQQFAYYDVVKDKPATWRVDDVDVSKGRLGFTLLTLKSQYKKKHGAKWQEEWKKLQFRVVHTIERSKTQKSLVDTYYVPMSNGTSPVANSLDRIKVVTVKPTAFRKIFGADTYKDKPGIDAVDVTFTDTDGRTRNVEISSFKQPEAFLVRKPGDEEPPVKIELLFFDNDGGVVPESGEPLTFEKYTKTSFPLLGKMLDPSYKVKK